jgi:hypothetical protein
LLPEAVELDNHFGHSLTHGLHNIPYTVNVSDGVIVIMASLLDTASGDTSKTECHFFRLPRELRDEIYVFIDFRNRQQNLDVLWGSTTMVKVAGSEVRESGILQI